MFGHQPRRLLCLYDMISILDGFLVLGHSTFPLYLSQRLSYCSVDFGLRWVKETGKARRRQNRWYCNELHEVCYAMLYHALD
jgi:hypothetical protein